MGKNKNKKKNQSGGVQKIPGVGLQTAHYKPRRRNVMTPPDDDNAEIEVLHESVCRTDASRVPVSQRLGHRPADPLPPGTHCKTGNFTARNYSTTIATGEPPIPGVCYWCAEYYFDLAPHFLSFHELEMVTACTLARSMAMQ